MLGTPGRLIDHLEKSESLKKLDKLEMLVLDEADRMLELGYLEKIKHIIMLAKERNENRKLQNVLLSATLGESVENLAGLALVEPKRIVVKDTEDDVTETFAVPESLRTCVSGFGSLFRKKLLETSFQLNRFFYFIKLFHKNDPFYSCAVEIAFCCAYREFAAVCQVTGVCEYNGRS